MAYHRVVDDTEYKGSDLPSMRVPYGITVRDVIEHRAMDEGLRLVAGADELFRNVDHPRVQKSGLALVGHLKGVVPSRIQVFGETEITFLEGLSTEERKMRLDELFALDLSLVVVTRGVEPPVELVEAARGTKTPLVIAQHRSSRTIQSLHLVLDELLAPSETRHGVLIDVHGVGMLLSGPSGIGKSECALFLVERGHRLVADDQVEIMKLPTGQVVGRAPAPLRHHLELRGIGIINVRDLFGATAVRNDKCLQLVVELCPWTEGTEFDRLGLDDETTEVLGQEITTLRIPVRSGRNMAVILEVAARNHLLKTSGHHAARKFVSTIAGGLSAEDVEQSR